MGGFVSGNYAYLAPHMDENQDPDFHGNVARILLTDFSRTGVSYHDLTDDNSNLRGFRNGFAAGGHAFFVPSHIEGNVRHGYLARMII